MDEILDAGVNAVSNQVQVGFQNILLSRLCADVEVVLSHRSQANLQNGSELQKVQGQVVGLWFTGESDKQNFAEGEINHK
jgi:hypothetical protein